MTRWSASGVDCMAPSRGLRGGGAGTYDLVFLKGMTQVLVAVTIVQRPGETAASCAVGSICRSRTPPSPARSRSPGGGLISVPGKALVLVSATEPCDNCRSPSRIVRHFETLTETLTPGGRWKHRMRPDANLSESEQGDRGGYQWTPRAELLICGLWVRFPPGSPAFAHACFCRELRLGKPREGCRAVAAQPRRRTSKITTFARVPWLWRELRLASPTLDISASDAQRAYVIYEQRPRRNNGS